MPAANKIVQANRPPAGKPLVGTYANDRGYQRERYKVGPRSYVEVYKHRRVARTPAGQQADHKDRNKANNRPGNLQNLTPAAHAAVGNRRRAVSALRSRRAARRAA
jgi:hypothetical protein